MAYNPYFNPYQTPYYPNYAPLPYPSVQPTQQAVQQMPVSNSGNVIWIEGESAAKSYPVAAGNTVILMDSENPVAYKKSTDMSGKPLPIEIYDLVRRDSSDMAEETHQINLEEYLTKKEFDKYASDIEQRFAEITDEEEYEEVKPVRRGRKSNG